MSKTKIDIVTALAETFGRTLSAPAAKLYVQALCGLSDEQAKRAASIAVQRCKFFPAASELIEYAQTGGVGFEAKAILAFEELEAALGANKPSLMSPVVAAITNQIGGFALLRDMPLDQFNTWKRKDFIQAHVTLSKENPQRLLALASPHSEIAEAFAGSLKRIPSREDVRLIEARNRQALQALGGK